MQVYEVLQSTYGGKKTWRFFSPLEKTQQISGKTFVVDSSKESLGHHWWEVLIDQGGEDKEPEAFRLTRSHRVSLPGSFLACGNSFSPSSCSSRSSWSNSSIGHNPPLSRKRKHTHTCRWYLITEVWEGSTLWITQCGPSDAIEVVCSFSKHHNPQVDWQTRMANS